MRGSNTANGEFLIRISGFRNISGLGLVIKKHGITIIIGENNIGKTNILDYIYHQNKKWDGFADEYIDGYYKYLNLFFGGEFRVVPPTHEYFADKKREKELECSYEIYYFDLETSIFPLTNEEGIIGFKKIKSRSCNLSYGDENIKNLFVLESAIMEKEEESELKLWIPDYKDKDNFVKHVEEDGTEKYRGFNKIEWVSHPIKYVGSGFIKYKTLESLIKKIIENYKDKHQWLAGTAIRLPQKTEIQFPVLLVDEPELLLHPSLISDVAQSIKSLKKNNITTVLTTHSPAFLSHFVNDLFSYNETNLVILQKGKNGEIKNPPLCLIELVREIQREISETWKNYCPCFKDEMENNENFYYDKWKTILNEHTLKIFFSKKILFVEGITDYLFFTNGFLRKNIPVLNEIEVIPIFGKLNYIFFSELTRKLGIKRRFLLDKDNNLIQENKKIEKGEMKRAILKNCKHETQKCTRQQVHKNFWDINTKGRLEEKNEEIIHDGEGEIDWFQQDIESFLEIEPKDMFIVSKELAMLNELEKSGSEKNAKWNERVAKLKKVLEKMEKYF